MYETKRNLIKSVVTKFSVALTGVRLLISCLNPEWEEGGEVFSSLVESRQ